MITAAFTVTEADVDHRRGALGDGTAPSVEPAAFANARDGQLRGARPAGALATTAGSPL